MSVKHVPHQKLKEIKDGTRFTNSHWKHIGLQKPILLVDFDHTITTKCLACEDGYRDNKAQRGAKEGFIELHKKYQIWIFTGNYHLLDPKVKLMKTIEEIETFLKLYGIPFDKILQIKPPACFIIDDRAIHHTSWKRTLNEITKRESKGVGV